MDCEHGIKEVGEADALRLGHEPEEGPISVEAPGPAKLGEIQTWFIASVQEGVGDPPRGVFIGEFEGVVTVPEDADHGGQGVRDDAADGGVGFKVFEEGHFNHQVGMRQELLGWETS
jgi:hypothetical protein